MIENDGNILLVDDDPLVNPRVAINDAGELLSVWAEGVGWQKGGALAWQLFDRSGQPTAEKGVVEAASFVAGFLSTHMRRAAAKCACA